MSLKDFFDYYFGLDEYYNDTLEIIKKLKKNGEEVYLLSNLRKFDFEHLKNDIDVSLFNKTFLSYEMKMVKPDVEIYKEVINQLQCKPKEIYFFDDNIINVTAAKKCGIISYCITGDSIKELFKKNNLLT